MSITFIRPALVYSPHEEEHYRRSIATALSVEYQTLRTFRTVTASETLTAQDDVVLADATSGAITLTLPPVTDGYKEFCVKKIDASANAVTIDGDGSETIDGATTLVLASQYDTAKFASDGTEWWIL